MSKLNISFGEIMLRLAPPNFERFLQSPQFYVSPSDGFCGTLEAFGLIKEG